MRKLRGTLLLLMVWMLATLLLVWHAQLAFIAQAAAGHMTIMWQRQPVAELLASDQVDDDLKLQLRYAQEAREFAVRELALPDNDSYRSYVDLQRKSVLWNVFAAPEFSTAAKKWCFPVAGCVGYRGYFDRNRAQQFASYLRGQGLEVHVGGVRAYSTLNWFDDPLLNTFFDRGLNRVAGLMFHELSHQLLYVPGDTTFNESFATVVELEGLRRWLQARGEPELLQAEQVRLDRQEAFIGLLVKTRSELTELYAREHDADVTRQAKNAIFTNMRSRYETLKQHWGGYAGYDAWFDTPVNNARLAAVGLYHQQVPALRALLKSVEGNLPAFYVQVRALAALKRDLRQTELERWRAVGRPQQTGG